MAPLYAEQNLSVTVPNTLLEYSWEYEYDETKKKGSSLKRLHTFQKSKSRSPVPPPSTNSVLDDMHMYTVAEVISKRDPFSLLSKHHLAHLDLGSTSFETCLAIEPPKKEHTTFRTPIGIRQRPVSVLDMQLVAMRNDRTAAIRSSNLRLKQMQTGESTKPTAKQEDTGPNSALFNNVVLRKRVGILGQGAHPRPVSASFVDPPTVQKVQAAKRMSLRSPVGSLTDLMQTPTAVSHTHSPLSQSPTAKPRPRRPAPQAPVRPPSRSRTPDSGRSTPKGFRTHSPLVASYSNPITTSSALTNSDAIPVVRGQPNGRITPPITPPMLKNNRIIPFQDRQTMSPPLVPGIRPNVSSPQLPMIPIREDEIMIASTPPEVMLSSPPPMTVNGRIPPPLLRRDSLYISPRKQSLKIETIDNRANLNQLRVSQILEMGGISGGGDLSNSRMNLLEAIQKGIQLKQVEKKARKESLVSMLWDVAAILERRHALELDTDSSEEESDDSEWLDDD